MAFPLPLHRQGAFCILRLRMPASLTLLALIWRGGGRRWPPSWLSAAVAASRPRNEDRCMHRQGGVSHSTVRAVYAD